MKPYSLDLREKVIDAVEKGDSSIRKVAQRFGVSKNFVQRLVTQKRTQGNILPRKQGGSMVSPVIEHKAKLMEIFEKQNDATLSEYCELLFNETGLWVSQRPSRNRFRFASADLHSAGQSTMCRTFQRLKLPLKKNAPLQPSTKSTSSTPQNRVLEASKRNRTRGMRASALVPELNSGTGHAQKFSVSRVKWVFYSD